MSRTKLFFIAAVLVAMACAFGTPPKRTQAILDVVKVRARAQGDVWFGDGDYPRCIQSLTVLHELFPHDYTLTTDLGWMYGNVENYGSELAVYVAYRQAFPSDPEAKFPEAFFYFRKRAYAKVPPLLEPSLKLKSPQPDSYRLLANSYKRLGLLTDSLRVWDSYLKLYPHDQTAIKNEKGVYAALHGASKA
jgi:tetratricopeptide (TPR) repeat protein